jgi:hypothetical protein
LSTVEEENGGKRSGHLPGFLCGRYSFREEYYHEHECLEGAWRKRRKKYIISLNNFFHIEFSLSSRWRAGGWEGRAAAAAHTLALLDDLQDVHEQIPKECHLVAGEVVGEAIENDDSFVLEESDSLRQVRDEERELCDPKGAVLQRGVWPIGPSHFVPRLNHFDLR